MFSRFKINDKGKSWLTNIIWIPKNAQEFLCAQHGRAPNFGTFLGKSRDLCLHRKIDQVLEYISWSLSRKARNSLIHALNGNAPRKKKQKTRTKKIAYSSFPVGTRSLITKALSKLCSVSIDRIPVKNGFRFHGEAVGMENFVVFFWISKKIIRFAGKGALSAKRWIWSELDIDRY